MVDPQSGGQPLKRKDGKLSLSVNGEFLGGLMLVPWDIDISLEIQLS